MMESIDSSPNHITVTKKENHAGGSTYDDIISAGSSSCGSVVHGPYIPKVDSSVKYRTSNKKLLKNVRSLRRRARSRLIQPSVVEMSDDTSSSHRDSIVDESGSSPNYLKATSSSEGKRSNFQVSPQASGSSLKFSSPSVRNVGILLKKSTSFKPKRSLLSYPRVAEDVAVDRATYSSTLKDSKFPKPIEIHPEGKELERDSAMKVCRYHHCSLHGHCHGSEDILPKPKRFQYKKRRSLKKQKSMTPKSESLYGNKRSADKRKNIQKNQMVSFVDAEVQERKSESMLFSGVESNNDMDSYAEVPAEIKSPLSDDEHSGFQDFDLSEIAFGETSFPERSYLENLNILKKYSPQEQDFGWTNSGLYGYCLKCSCSIREQIMPPPGYVDEDLSMKQVIAYTIGNRYSSEIPCIRDVYVPDASSSVLVKASNEPDSSPVNNIESFDKEDHQNEGFCKDFPQTPVIFDKVTKTNGGFSSASDIQTMGNSKGDGEPTTEPTPVLDSKESEVVQIKDDKKDSPAPEGVKLQFSKQRHISMWHLIQQRMSSDLAAEVVNKPQQCTDGEIHEDAANLVPAKENSASEKAFSDADVETGDNGLEIQEIELRKLFAIKLVREAIEKILLPEIQDQTSDDQSITSENTPRPELVKENEADASIQESSRELVFDNKEGKVPSIAKEESLIVDVASGPDIVKTGKKSEGVSEKKAPKHWSNLKKWILLQRFIRELEKVRKFNPRKPRLLPSNADPEAEKITLRAQTVEERKKAEEWMLDYALRQAVSQLAPTQKKKVALLVKAFETVVPSQEDPQVQFKITRVEENGFDGSTTGYKVLEAVAEEVGEHKEEVPFDEKAKLASNDKASGSGLVTRERGIKLTGDSESDSGLNDVCGEPLVINQRSSEEILGDTEVIENSTVSFNEETQESECGTDKPSLTNESMILDGNGEPAISENTFHSASHSDTHLEKLMADGAEIRANSGMKDLQGGRTPEFKDTNEALNSPLEREKHIRMWHMIYQHVVSGIAEKVGSKLLDGSDDDEIQDDTTSKINISDDFKNSKDFPRIESHASSHRKSGFTKSDALKLIKEAVDEILLPEIPDNSSDTQSITSEFDPEQEISERKDSKIGAGRISSECSLSINKEEKMSTDDAVSSGQDSRIESPVRNKSELPKPKSWSKLKKLILLKRSIRALEKATKLKPKVQSLVPQMPDIEPEKIDLRHPMTNERNKAEQWMLDYAVQHIVTKLTPARKKRVAMLVEAFEAVVPLPDT